MKIIKINEITNIKKVLKEVRKKDKETTDFLEALLNKYKTYCEKEKAQMKIDLDEVTKIVYKYLTLSKNSKNITKGTIVQRFSFLEESKFFHQKFEKEDYYFYQFKEEAAFGEVQYIFLKIPKRAHHHFGATFKLIRKGKCQTVYMHEYPHWFESLYNQAKEESKNMLKLRRLLDVK